MWESDIASGMGGALRSSSNFPSSNEKQFHTKIKNWPSNYFSRSDLLSLVEYLVHKSMLSCNESRRGAQELSKEPSTSFVAEELAQKEIL
jgi:hypothetical protein